MVLAGGCAEFAVRSNSAIDTEQWREWPASRTTARGRKWYEYQTLNAEAGSSGSKRKHKFNWFDPAILEVAISV
eukprot:1510203-Rhodomonas_salina.1